MIAYFIMIHKNFEQVHRLINAVYHPGNLYIVHQDSKSVNPLGKFDRPEPNIYMLEPQPVYWGGWSQVEIQLRAIQEALQHSGWTHFVNLSGQCFPLRTQDTIIRFLADNQDTNFIGFTDPDDADVKKFIRNRQMKTVDQEGRVVGENKKPLDAAHYHLGSGWFFINRKFCEFLMTDPIVHDLSDYYTTGLSPDESFFQTAILLSPEKENINLNFKRSLEMDHINQGGHHPKIYGAQDLEMLMKSDALFARKFDAEQDSVILDYLEYILK